MLTAETFETISIGLTIRSRPLVGCSPNLSEKQIRMALEKLVSAELIIKGNFNDGRYARTCWYALGKSICSKVYARLVVPLQIGSGGAHHRTYTCYAGSLGRGGHF